MHERAGQIREDRRRRRRSLYAAATAVFCLLLGAGTGLFFHALRGTQAADPSAGQAAGSFTASFFAGSGFVSYAATGIIAFLLGISVTLFCYMLKRQFDKDRKKNDRDPG